MGQLDYRLLGALEVVAEGEPLPLGRRQQRGVLAILLLHANRAVSTDQLIELLWPGKPPARPQTAIQGYVSALRKLLGREAIETSGGGYLLRVDPEWLDLHRFERLLVEGRRTREERPGRAAVKLAEALALWRGRALADFAYEAWAQSEIGRLEELCLVAGEELTEARLALGEHAQLVGELEALIREQPLRERPRGQLMLALYRCGRQAEALELYQQARTALLEELGIDPSPELQALYKQILNQDETLTFKARPPTPPTNLPVPPTPLVGRTRELAELCSLLRQPSVRLVTLTGPGGTGKTRLALAAAAELVGEEPDGVWLVDLAPLREPALVLESAAQVLGAKRELSAHIADKQLLLLFDNFEQVAEAAFELGELLTACPNLKALVTSREPLHLTAEREYPVPPLAEAEAVILFMSRAQAVKPDFTADGAVAEICRRVDCLPLALELAATRVGVLTPPKLLERLEQRLLLLTGGPRDAPQRQQTLRDTIAWSYELLSPDERQLFARFAVFAAGCTLETAEEVCGSDLDTLQSLVDKSLVRRSEDRFRMLETIREYALEQLETSGEAERVRELHLLHVLELAEHASLKLMGKEQQLWLERLEEEHDNMRAALSWSLGKEPELALRLVAALGPFWFAWAHFGEARTWLGAALQQTASNESGARASALYWAARTAGKQSDWELDLRLAREALALFRSLGDGEGCALCLAELGWVEYLHGRYERARSLCEESVALARGRPDSRGLINALNNLAHAELELGERVRAKALYEEVASICRDRGDTRGLAMVLQSLGAMMFEAKDYDQASPLLEEGLHLARAVEPGLTLGYVVDLGMLALEQQDFARALSMAKEALTLSNEFGDKYGATYALELVGSLAAERGEPAGAATLLSAARQLRAAIGRPMTPADMDFLEPRALLARAQLGDSGWAKATIRPLVLEQAFIEASRIAAAIEAKGVASTTARELSRRPR